MKKIIPYLRPVDRLAPIEEETKSSEPELEPSLFDDLEKQIHVRVEEATGWDNKVIGGPLLGDPILSPERLQIMYYPDKSLEELQNVFTYAERYRRVEKAIIKDRDFFLQEINSLETIVDIFPEIAPLIPLIKKQYEQFLEIYEKNCRHSKFPEDEATEQDELHQLEEAKARLEIIEKIVSEKINQIGQKRLGGLVDRARSDVQMFLIRYINISEADMATAQDFLKQKTNDPATVHFVFWPEDTKMLAGAYSDTNSILFNMALTPRLSDNTINEALVQHPIVHEYIHTVSHGFDDPEGKTPLGLSDETIFDQPKFTDHRFFARKTGPETALNELMTEAIALMITKKHYSDNPPGTYKMSRNPEQEVRSYDFLVNPFRQLEEKYGKKFKQVSELMTKAMIQGKIDELKKFFIDEPALFSDIKTICENGVKLCAPTS